MYVGIWDLLLINQLQFDFRKTLNYLYVCLYLQTSVASKIIFMYSGKSIHSIHCNQLCSEGSVATFFFSINWLQFVKVKLFCEILLLEKGV